MTTTLIQVHRVTDVSVTRKDFGSPHPFHTLTVTATDNEGNKVALELFTDEPLPITGEIDVPRPEPELEPLPAHVEALETDLLAGDQFNVASNLVSKDEARDLYGVGDAIAGMTERLAAMKRRPAAVPTEPRCRYCGERTEVNGDGLWFHSPTSSVVCSPSHLVGRVASPVPATDEAIALANDEAWARLHEQADERDAEHDARWQR